MLFATLQSMIRREEQHYCSVHIHLVNGHASLAQVMTISPTVASIAGCVRGRIPTFAHWTARGECDYLTLSLSSDWIWVRILKLTSTCTCRLLYDLERDPYQMRNIVAEPAQQSLVRELDSKSCINSSDMLALQPRDVFRANFCIPLCEYTGMLSERLDSVGDPFDSGDKMIDKWGYITNANGTVPYTT